MILSGMTHRDDCIGNRTKENDTHDSIPFPKRPIQRIIRIRRRLRRQYDKCIFPLSMFELPSCVVRVGGFLVQEDSAGDVARGGRLKDSQSHSRDVEKGRCDGSKDLSRSGAAW